MKKIKLLGKRIFVALLVVSMLIPSSPVTRNQTVEAAETEEKSSKTGSNNSESTTELIKDEFGEEIKDSDSSVSEMQKKNKGKNPLTGNNDRAIVLNPSYELLVGRTGIGISGNQDSLDTGTETKLQQKVYDFEGTSGKKVSDLNDTA